MFVLFNLVAAFIIERVSAILGIGLLSTLYSCAVLCPSVCLNIRRLHDVDKSGWWLLLMLVPLANFYAMYLIWFKKGTEGSNRFGAPSADAVSAATAASEKAVYGEYTVKPEEPKDYEPYMPPMENQFSGYDMCPKPQSVKAANCAYCGEELESGAKFCSNCGAPVGK